MAVPDITSKYSYADYLTWEGGSRWELIDGVAYEKAFGDTRNMSPAPFRKHQQISMRLSSSIFEFLKGKPCEVYAALFDVRFENADADKIFTVVQPDISIICDKNKLDERGAIGAPDWIIEILSPSTAMMDLNTKLLLYQKYLVKEYWIIDPDKENVIIFILNQEHTYDLPQTLGKSEQAFSKIIKGYSVQISELFE